MQSQAEDVYHSDMARSWSEDETLVSLSYLGNYLLTSKKSNEDYWGSNNILYLVYKAQIKDTYSEDGKTMIRSAISIGMSAIMICDR